LLILIDTNIAMYVWGAPHELQAPSRTIIRLAGQAPAHFFTDSEVLQEMLHRYRALRYWPLGRRAISAFARLLEGRVQPMLAEDVRHAAELADRYSQLSARDLIHVAIAIRSGATHIVTADSSFEVVTEIERLDPMRVEEWRGAVSEK